MAISDRIASVARSFVGELEIPQNVGFKNHAFRMLLEGVGWRSGSAWCMYFAKMVWIEAYGETVEGRTVARLLGGNCRVSERRWIRDTGLSGLIPTIGSIAIFYRQHSKTLGHAAIVTGVGDGSFSTIEGNTTIRGVREGDGVFERRRLLNFDAPVSRKSRSIIPSLVLHSFLYPL